MERRIIGIDREKCDGCGSCVDACHEGALGIVEGKARLLRDDHCDGLGDCLPACPRDAISFETREAAPFDPDSVKPANKCKGGAEAAIERADNRCGELSQWPIQLKLVPRRSSFYDGADLLIAADCTAFAHADFHRNFIKGRIALIGCPKFDSGDYIERLSEIFEKNDIASITVVRMKVPCCMELERMVKSALAKSQKMIPYRVVVLGTDGKVVA